MKLFINIVILFLLISCQKDKKEQNSYFMATKGRDVALLRMVQENNRFWGYFEIRYGGGSVKDFGEIRGEKIGDTLKGKFNCNTYGGSKKWVPFVLLAKDQNYKFGSGICMTFMNFPYFDPETLVFDTTDFLFQPIDTILVKKMHFDQN